MFISLETYRRRQGYQLIAGVDEVGRGAWAGPLVAAAIILKPYAKLSDLKESKQLSTTARERWVEHLQERHIAIGYGVVSEKEIDVIGIGAANRLAFKKALAALSPQPHYALADYFSLSGLAYVVEGVRGGDLRVRSIAAASIVAKVYRDNLLLAAEERYPGYGFAAHKGYGTAAHRRAIKKLGLSNYHRKSWQYQA